MDSDWVDDLLRLPDDEFLDAVNKMSSREYTSLPFVDRARIARRYDGMLARDELAEARAEQPPPELAVANLEGGGTTFIEVPRSKERALRHLLIKIDNNLKNLTRGDLDIHGVTFEELQEMRTRIEQEQQPPEELLLEEKDEHANVTGTRTVKPGQESDDPEDRGAPSA